MLLGPLFVLAQATEQHAQALERELSMRPTSRLVEDLRHQIRMLQVCGPVK